MDRVKVNPFEPCSSLGVAWLLGYTEGREAHRRGISSRANPFEPCSSLGVAWLLGYTESWESQTECGRKTTQTAKA